MTATPAPAPARPGRSTPPGLTPLALITGFLPWIVFSVVSQRLAADAVAWSALLATAMAAVAVLRDRRRHGPQILDLGSLVLFAVIAVTGFVGGTGVDRWLFEWGRPLVGVVLGLYLLLTVPVLPFTAEYARRTTPREYWDSPHVQEDQPGAQRGLGGGHHRHGSGVGPDHRPRSRRDRYSR